MTEGLKLKKMFKGRHLATKRLKNGRQVQSFSRQIKETQSVGVHDVLNAQEFAMHYRAILNG